MALGPGKYDAQCTAVRRATQARGVIVIVVDGTAGSGFSCQADAAVTANLPALLQHVAAEIRLSLDPHSGRVDAPDD